MKKLLLLSFTLFFFAITINSNSQSIQSVNITSSISCYGDFASINIQINQTNPPTFVKLVVGYYPFPNFFIPITSTNNTTLTNINIPGLAAQNYTVRLVDSVSYYSTNPAGSNPSSIYDISTINITQPLQLSNTANQNAQIQCNGDCDASVGINITGGTPPYNLSFGSGTSNTISGLSASFNNLCDGNYSISITDANSCTVDVNSPTSILISQPSLLALNANITSNYSGQNISCFGASDGEITASASGGTSPYLYSLDGINFTSDSIFSGLTAGTYTIHYQDANGCDTSEQITLNNPPDISGTISVTSPVTCSGVCDGILNFLVDNILTGTSPYTYSLNGGAYQNSSTFTGLCGGINHQITVKDANGCTYTASKFLSAPSAVSFTYTTSNYNNFNISCFGFNDGQISFNPPTGGQAPYTYSIDGINFSNSMTFSNLSSGNYSISVRDVNGCVTSVSETLNEPLQFSLNYSVDNNISCPEICDGQISVIPSSGVNPIIYDLTGYSSQTSTTWSGLCGDITFGSYNLTATDDNGCTASTQISLSEPLPFVFTLDSITETCNLSNGGASISITQGGTTPYSYSWDDPNNQNTPFASALETGLYSVTITDANGCQFIEDVNVIETDIILTFDSIPPCNGANDGQATVNPVGTPPYSILWETSSTSNTITGLSPGFYSVTVSDNTGCIVTDSVEIPSSVNVSVTLDSVNSTLNVLCNGYQSDTIIVNASGGTGIGTYQYYIPGAFPIPQYNNIFSGLYPGTYIVYAEDANGCSDTVTVSIVEPDIIYYTANSTDVSCNLGNNGTVNVDSISGGTPPYFYNWSTGSNNSSVSQLISGTYTVTVTDINNCASNPSQVSVVVDEPSLLISNTTVINHSSCSGSQTAANGEAEVVVSGGTPGYTYSWSNGYNTENISLLFPGIYYVDITDANGCVILDSVIINPGTNPILNVQVQNVSCFGANDGLMITSANSGTAPYSFSADGGNTFVPSGTNFGPSGPASYFITVVDNDGCTDSDSVYVNEPNELIINSLIANNVLCYDSANGQIFVNLSGGTQPFSYQWNNGQSSNPAIDLIPSTYNVTVTDSMGCIVSSNNQIITQPDSLYIDNINISDVSCNGGNDGSVIVSANGGTPSYTFAFSGSGSNQNLNAGSYIATVIDNNGCSSIKQFNINEPSPISVQFIRDSVTCIGGSDGMAMAIISGGIPNYTLLWDNGSSSSQVNNFNAGYHTLNVQDSNGCLLIDSIEILQPLHSIEIDSLIISDITCHDANNASITVLANGGQLPYVYSNTNGIFTQNSIAFVNLSPNQYIIYVRDAKGCVDRDTVIVNQPDSLYIDTTIYTNITCHGLNNGQILSINAVGGTVPYLYSVNGGSYHSNMAYFHSYGPGTYTVQVVDDNNCSAQDIIIIEEPDELDVTITTSNWSGYEIRCNGSNTGTALISINGGNGPYNKEVIDQLGNIIYNGSQNYITNLTAGLYTFNITDDNGCEYSESIQYQEPSIISHNFIIDHITCDGWSNGSITDSVYGGVGSSTTYSYLWDTGDTTYSLSNVGIGNYTITVTDLNNCSTNATATINSDNILSTSIISSQEPTCWNYCDGEISVGVVGGVPNINSSGNPVYNYQWDDFLSQNTSTAIGLCVDEVTNSSTFNCIITDAIGCTTIETFTLNQPDIFEVSIWQTDEVLCNGGNEASLSVTTSGGNAGTVNYTWNTGLVTFSTSIGNLAAGNYVVVAEDPLGCMDTTNYIIEEPLLLEAYIFNQDILDVKCYGEYSGEVTVTVQGGTTNVTDQYIYNWTPNAGNAMSSFDFNTSIGTGTLTDLDTGIYQVQVTDINNCLAVSNMIYISQPTNPLSIFTDSTDETCLNEGSATAYVLGGTPGYSYLWSPGGYTTAAITSLDPNTTYIVEVIDNNGCIIIDTTYINGHKNVFLPNNESFLDSTICLGKSVFIEIEEKPNHSYVWKNTSSSPDEILSTNPSIIVTPNQGVTNYELFITDEVNCPNSPFSVEATFLVNPLNVNPIAEPNPIILGSSTELTLSNSFSNIEWIIGLDTIQTNSYLVKPDSSTTYHVIATDNIGCQGISSVYVIVGAVPYDAITPNGDGDNDEWEILDIEEYPNSEIKIFNRWGILVFSSKGSNYNNNKWDGTNAGEILPVGTYYYTINPNDGSPLQTGAVTLVR